MIDAYFWMVHSGLKREGPGDEASLRRALGRMSALPTAPAILDVGCGPGAQSLALAELTRGTITSVDTHQAFLDDLAGSARERGVGDRVTTLKASMTAMPFAEGSFDLIWCEGAIYFMGFREGLTAWKRFLRPGGYIAVTEPCWLKPEADIPGDVRAEWQNEYPAMTTVENILAGVAACGYRVLDHFVLPQSAWWNYYGPKEARIALLREQHQGDAVALKRFGELQSEIDNYRKHADFYSYLFVVMQRD
jgi:SAM-dependent methyltransferase